MGNKDKTLNHRKKKRRTFHGNRFTKLSGTAQISTPSCLSSSSTTLNKSQHDDIVCKSLSSKKLKLNLEHQITANDTNREEDLIDNIDPSSSSSEENNDIDHEDEDSCHTRFYEKRDTSYYLLIDSDILETVIQTIGRCPIDNCSGKVKLKNNFSKKVGLSCNLELSCASEWQTNIFTSKKIPTSRAFDINLRLIIAFCENGKCHTGYESCLYVHTLNLVHAPNE